MCVRVICCIHIEPNKYINDVFYVFNYTNIFDFKHLRDKLTTGPYGICSHTYTCI